MVLTELKFSDHSNNIDKTTIHKSNGTASNDVVLTGENTYESKNIDGGWSWLVLLVSLFGTTIVGCSYSLFSLLYKDFIIDFEVSTSAAGWIGSIHVGCGNIAAVFLGVAIERFGCRLVCLVGTVIASLGYFLSYYATHIILIYFSFGLLAGVGMGMIAMSSIIATQQCFDKKRAFAGAVATVGYSLGSITSGLFMRYFYEKISWQSICVVFACFTLQMAVLATLTFGPSSLPLVHKKQEGQETKGNKFSQYFKVLCQPAVLTFLLANFVVHIGLTTQYQHTPNRAMSLGITATQIAVWPMTTAAANLVAKMIGGLIANLPCVNRLIFYSAMIFLSGVTQSLMPLCIDFSSIIVQGIVQNIFNGAFICVLTTIMVDLVGINDIAKSQALLALSVGTGVVISTPFAGYLYDITKNYDVTFIVTGVILISGTFFSLLSSHYQKKKEKQCNDDVLIKH